MTTFPGNATPRPFPTIFAEHELTDLFNATVGQLSRAPQAQMDIMRTLSRLGQTLFIDLVTEPLQAKIAMAMHAGDGIVTKITPKEFMATTAFPLVIPSFMKTEVNCGPEIGCFVIQNFPLVRATRAHAAVEDVRAQLQWLGLRFGEGDDKPSNIGIMPNGEPWILDGDAVDVTHFGEPYESRRQQALDVCIEKMREFYPDLYDGNFVYRQSASPQFDLIERPSPVRPPPEPQPSAPTRTTFQQVLWGLGIGGKK